MKLTLASFDPDTGHQHHCPFRHGQACIYQCALEIYRLLEDRDGRG